MANRSYIIIPLLISAVILFFSLVWPKYQDLQLQQLNVSQKAKELEKKEDYFEEIKKIHKELGWEDNKELIASIDSMLPDEPSIPSIFHYIKEIAKVTVNLREIALETGRGSRALEDVTSVAEKPTIKEIYFTVSLAGDYHPHFKSFLLAVENSARLFEIENISFSSPEVPEEPFSFEIELKTYGY